MKGIDAEDTGLRRTLLDVFSGEIPGFDAASLGRSFDELGIDSFDALTLRAAVERALGRIFSDDEWMSCLCPHDVVTIAHRDGPLGGMAAEPQGIAGRRYTLGMPQLSPHGLSEGWLFREVGDFHWSLIAEGLGASTTDIVDGMNRRLYATFSRLRVRAGSSLAAFGEADTSILTGALTRFGAGMFIGEYRFAGPRGELEISAMSNFAYRGVEQSNTALLRGQPVIPPGCAIAELAELPPFAQQYRHARHDGRPLKEPIAQWDYRIVPQHDMNGAGLLYFAAFPVIADICDGDIEGSPHNDRVTVERDIFYFANCDTRETLRYRLHERSETGGRLRQIASLSRSSDGALMAVIDTTKAVS